MTKKMDEQWQFWSGAHRGRGPRKGCFISLSPCGTILISAELVERLGAGFTCARIAYSLIRKAMRIYPQAQSGPGAYRWRRGNEKVGRIGGRAMLEAWAIRPQGVAFYAGEYRAERDGEPAYIEADLSKPIDTVPSPAKAGPGHGAKAGKCPECGSAVVVEINGGSKTIRPHKDPDGEPCLCRRPEK